mmetsp:Transcript_47281/g.143176  ORF Transcript_47281/g.143176 Transcript_47281/m.143176 type:complete len:89 (+) Transcript_47281:2547-2813(+)
MASSGNGDIETTPPEKPLIPPLPHLNEEGGGGIVQVRHRAEIRGDINRSKERCLLGIVQRARGDWVVRASCNFLQVTINASYQPRACA